MDDFERELGEELLASVARSFYLSLKFLPPELRGPASLGYLLARSTDTVADTEAAPAGNRLRLLAQMFEAVNDGADPDAVADELRALAGDDAQSAGEAMLLASFGRCVEWLSAVPEWQRAAIRKVMGPIMKGQVEDLQRFEGEGVKALESDQELEQYAFDVAGCVGIFWTDLGFGAFGDSFAERARPVMEEFGESYGKGLQLLNILRDFPEDFAAGRCYFPGANPAAGPEALWGEHSPRWLARCRELLGAAPDYIDAVHGKRARLATALPVLIGAKTLALIESADWEALQAGVKISRSEVSGLVAKAGLINIKRHGLGKMSRDLLG